MRADALDNRERLLDAARAVYASHGIDAPLRMIARRAGVGPATLYRHFPTKQALATEAFANEMADCRAIVLEGAADPDAWRGFCHVIEEICEIHTRNRGFTAAFMTAFPGAIDLATERRELLEHLTELTARAQAAGDLRADFRIDDLLLMLTAHRGVRAGSPQAELAASRRFAALTIEAFRA